MTLLGEYLTSKSVSKAEVARKTGLSASRLSELSRNNSTVLKAEELYLIALAIDVNPEEIMLKIYGHIKLKKLYEG